MDPPRNFNNLDQIGLSNYSKMENNTSIASDLNGVSQQQKTRLTIEDMPRIKGCFCVPPHRWRLTECCCGCTLRVATLLIGWIYLIGSIILTYLSMIIPRGHIPHAGEFVSHAGKLLISLFILVGVYKEKHVILRTGLVLLIIDMALEIAFAGAGAIQDGIIFPVTIMVVWLPLGIYFIVVMNSFASQIYNGNVRT